MRKQCNLVITHLYSKYMNLYGDKGNVIALVKRCKWRGIGVRVKNINLEDRLPKSNDIYFMGGGQDRDQLLVFQDLLKRKKVLVRQIEKGIPFLAICGAYQLLGKYFLAGDGKKMKGIGVLNIKTTAPDRKVKSRCIGNITARLNPEIFAFNTTSPSTIVGFENHSGQTYLGKGVVPMAYVKKGFGNNMQDNTEGCIYKNVIGTYLHGSFLPKNPHIADFLLRKALKRKYGEKAELKKLEDTEEIQAHNSVLNKI